jgi:hypothetical protein
VQQQQQQPLAAPQSMDSNLLKQQQQKAVRDDIYRKEARTQVLKCQITRAASVPQYSLEFAALPT